MDDGYLAGLLLAAISSLNARKPSWAWEASFSARERMQALYWSTDRVWPPGPPEQTWNRRRTNKANPTLISSAFIRYGSLARLACFIITRVLYQDAWRGTIFCASFRMGMCDIFSIYFQMTLCGNLYVNYRRLLYVFADVNHLDSFLMAWKFKGLSSKFVLELRAN